MSIQTEFAPPRILPREATADLLGVNLRTLERLVATGQFPKPVRISRNRLGFLASEVADWIATRPRVG
jgi:predicted DNA-binding transcriptional regulator AlpA